MEMLFYTFYASKHNLLNYLLLCAIISSQRAYLVTNYNYVKPGDNANSILNLNTI